MTLVSKESIDLREAVGRAACVSAAGKASSVSETTFSGPSGRSVDKKSIPVAAVGNDSALIAYVLDNAASVDDT